MRSPDRACARASRIPVLGQRTQQAGHSWWYRGGRGCGAYRTHSLPPPSCTPTRIKAEPPQWPSHASSHSFHQNTAILLVGVVFPKLRYISYSSRNVHNNPPLCPFSLSSTQNNNTNISKKPATATHLAGFFYCYIFSKIYGTIPNTHVNNKTTIYPCRCFPPPIILIFNKTCNQSTSQ